MTIAVQQNALCPRQQGMQPPLYLPQNRQGRAYKARPC